MEARAYLRNARISPRKVQIVLDLIRNKPVDMALAALDLTPKAASPIVSKLVKSAQHKEAVVNVGIVGFCGELGEHVKNLFGVL
jgi:ribosomal protein L22